MNIVGYADIRRRALDQMLARDMVRLRNPETGEYLHASGTGTVFGIDWSWLGFRRQAEALRQATLSRNEPWVFIIVHRDENEEIANLRSQFETECG
ncbi:hypothetical protein [Ruegeria arenilitoris]|uniref:hypothetical protein n=1 Tax=Ruegeria arenilitoris TaxID=1173585 RepID=UPI00147E7514|nr:hypothetical protein [Ruegeria arenilitoris]